MANISILRGGVENLGKTVRHFLAGEKVCRVPTTGPIFLMVIAAPGCTVVPDQQIEFLCSNISGSA